MINLSPAAEGPVRAFSKGPATTGVVCEPLMSIRLNVARMTILAESLGFGR
jgi:hypothetical protein